MKWKGLREYPEFSVNKMFLPIRDSRFNSKKTKCSVVRPHRKPPKQQYLSTLSKNTMCRREKKKKSLCKFSRTKWLNEPWAENILTTFATFPSLIVKDECPIMQNSSGSSSWEIFSGLCSEWRCDVIAVTREAIILYDLYNTKTNPSL